jgi:hypothetical protein
MHASAAACCRVAPACSTEVEAWVHPLLLCVNRVSTVSRAGYEPPVPYWSVAPPSVAAPPPGHGYSAVRHDAPPPTPYLSELKPLDDPWATNRGIIKPVEDPWASHRGVPTNASWQPLAPQHPHAQPPPPPARADDAAAIPTPYWSVAPPRETAPPPPPGRAVVVPPAPARARTNTVDAAPPPPPGRAKELQPLPPTGTPPPVRARTNTVDAPPPPAPARALAAPPSPPARIRANSIDSPPPPTGVLPPPPQRASSTEQLPTVPARARGNSMGQSTLPPPPARAGGTLPGGALTKANNGAVANALLPTHVAKTPPVVIRAAGAPPVVGESGSNMAASPSNGAPKSVPAFGANTKALLAGLKLDDEESPPLAKESLPGGAADKLHGPPAEVDALPPWKASPPGKVSPSPIRPYVPPLTQPSQQPARDESGSLAFGAHTKALLAGLKLGDDDDDHGHGEEDTEFEQSPRKTASKTTVPVAMKVADPEVSPPAPRQARPGNLPASWSRQEAATSDETHQGAKTAPPVTRPFDRTLSASSGALPAAFQKSPRAAPPVPTGAQATEAAKSPRAAPPPPVVGGGDRDQPVKSPSLRRPVRAPAAGEEAAPMGSPLAQRKARALSSAEVSICSVTMIFVVSFDSSQTGANLLMAVVLCSLHACEHG